jgi:hypothetical protein
MFLRGSGRRRLETPDGSAPLERGERPSRWKETPEVPAPYFFGDRGKKNERGMKKAGASSHIQRKKTREVPKLKRATASLQFEIQLGGGWCG